MSTYWRIVQLASKWQRELAKAPRLERALRLVIAIAVVVVVSQIARHSPLAQPVSGVITMGTVLLCSWIGGLSAAVMMSPLLVLLGRIYEAGDARWALPTMQEWLAIVIIALVSVAFGLAGAYRRRMVQATEQHRQKLQDQARALRHAPILFRTLEGRITDWNGGTERLYGWTCQEAIGQDIQELLQTEFKSSRESVHQELLDTGQWQGEAIQRHRDGRAMHITMHWILYRDQFGEVQGVAQVHNDVTELRQAEEKIREADRHKDEFIAVLAHELRNPLAPIRTGLEIMKLAKDDPNVVEQTRDVMERQMKQMVRLVDDLLDVSRVTRGSLTLQKTEVSVKTIVQCAVEAARPAIDAAGHQLEVELDGCEEVVLDADEHRMAQVLSNLLDNAAKYTPAQGRIWLNVEHRHGEIIFAVRDNGIGVPLEMLERIFDMFSRSGREIEMLHSGLGIGLALVKSIVQMHNGTVEVTSDGTDHGAEFRVRLPVSQNRLEHIQIPAPATNNSNHDAHRVLIVDDNQAAADLLSLVVKSDGCEVRVAYDGLQAVDLAGRFRPNVVLMDLGMPHLDGYGAARRMREQPWGREIFLVAITGWGQDSHKLRAKEAGFDYHLVKPADPAEIRRLLEQARVRA